MIKREKYKYFINLLFKNFLTFITKLFTSPKFTIKNIQRGKKGKR